MPKLNKDDQARLDQLVRHIHTLVGRKLVEGQEDPLLLSPSEIESHRGRVGKAVRLLCDNGHLKFSCRKTIKVNYYGSHQTQTLEYYEVLTLDQTKDVEPYEFIQDFNGIHNRLYGMNSSDAEDFAIAGYDYVDTLGIQVLHVHWHPELYDTHNEGERMYVYPKALQEIRTKLLLRAIVEHHLANQYADRLANKIGLPEKSIPTVDYKSIQYRSCGHTLGMLSEKGMASYLEEYEFRAKYFQNLIEGIKFLREKARTSGGFEELLKTLRQEIMAWLLRECPKHMNEPEVEAYSWSNKFSNQVRHSESLVIMRNAEYWKYETLYGEDPSVVHVDEDSVQEDQHDTFEPDEDDQRVVSSSPDQLWVTQEEPSEEPA